MKREPNNWVVVAVLAVLLFVAIRGGVVPEPTPTPEPTPVVIDDAPFPSDNLAVLIVEETSERRSIPQSQVNVLTSLLVREAAASGGGDIRVWDQDVEANYEAEKWRQALRLPRDSLPWIYIAHDGKGFSGPLPQSVDKTIQLIGKFQ